MPELYKYKHSSTSTSPIRKQFPTKKKEEAALNNTNSRACEKVQTPLILHYFTTLYHGNISTIMFGACAHGWLEWLARIDGWLELLASIIGCNGWLDIVGW
jgi:hypothetical protein